MAKKILLGLAAIVGAFLIYVALKPGEMLISRDMLIKAAPEAIFPYLNNSKKANEWMPWADEDPGVKMIYSGPEEGVGSTSTWDSKGKMGTGKAEVVESIPNQIVKTQLTYTRPMQMSQLAEISLKTTNDGTLVHWSVVGQNSFICRLFGTFMNMDKIVGSSFEKGLSTLKAKVESGK